MAKAPMSREGQGSAPHVEPVAQPRRTPEEDVHTVYPVRQVEQRSVPIEDGATWDNHNID